jgi:hypothetical protein
MLYFSNENQVLAQTPSVKTIFTEQKCDELIHRLSDSIMNITGDVKNNFLKINEMTNRVTYQFINEFDKKSGKPFSKEDYNLLWEKAKQCINAPTNYEASYKACVTCQGFGHILCDICHGRAFSFCNTCNSTGFIMSNGNKITCTQCNGKGQLFCYRCNGNGQILCYTCGGAGFLWKQTK